MTTSMYSHHECKSKDSGSSKFTAHAAVQLQRRHSLRCEYAAADQLLGELNVKASGELKNLVHNTFPTCNVNLIHAVNAPQMYGMYLLRKEEMRLSHVGYSDKELILYHVTTKSRALESLKRGLSWRRIRRSKFGRGVSFSDDADYANYYADNFLKEDSRVIIVCAVLVNKTHQVSGKRNERNLIVPPGTVDTTVGHNGRVYVKYNDYDFYPLYFMYYQRTPEHFNESKYFRNNLHNKWQQNNLVMQQQREQEQAQKLQAQRYRERAQLEFSQKLQQELQKQRSKREQSQKLQAQEIGEQSQKLQAQEVGEQSQKPQAQPVGEQSQVEFLRTLQQELREQREREQAQRQLELMAQRERMQEWRQQELQEQREREQAQRQLELMAQRERMQEWRQQELQEQREREQIQRQLELMEQRERMQEWRQQELQEQREREQIQRQLELMEQRERMREWRQQELREQEDEARQPLLEQTPRRQEYAQQREINTKLCCLIL